MKIFKITSILNVIYIGVIISFFYVFYSGDDIYTHSIDNLEIVEVSTIEFPLVPKRNRSLDISYKGLSFNISRNSPITITSRDNIVRSSKVIGTTFDDNRIIIDLENEISLNIRIDNHGQRLTVGTSIPKVFPTIKEVTIPFILSEEYTLEQNDLSYKISGKNDEFHLKLNDNYYIDEQLHRIHLTTDDDKLSNLTFSPLDSSDLHLAEQWYKTFQAQEKIDIDSLLDSYLSKVTRSISLLYSQMRYNSQTEAWQNLPSTTKFTEDSAIVYLAEGLQNTSYISKRDRIEELARRYPSKFTYKSTPYIGNLVINGQKEYIEREEQLSEISTYIRYADENLFSTWIPDHYFDGENFNMLLFEIGILSKSPDEMNLNSLGVTLNNLLKVEERGNSSSNVVDAIKEITDLIIERITWDDNGLFLVEDDEISYMDLNLKIGELLINASQHDSNKYSKIIGESLISTYINNSDRDGNTPETYNPETEEFSEEEIAAALSYFELSDNEFLPHYYESEKIKLWTISDSVDIVSNTNETRITISLPIDYRSTENYQFLTISGVKPYTQLFLSGRSWRPDRSFEKWGVGYYYDTESELLFFMPKHTKEREEILIIY